MSNHDQPDAASLRDIYLRAVEKRTPQERAAFLDGACGNDLSLRTKVEALLRENADDSFLEHPAVEGATLIEPGQLSEGPGTEIGRYKLLQKIGEGGMGVVYMAEQTQPVTRKVALKIIKLGMDTAQVVARFEAERQALAMMDHPNIAKVLDAGATDTGRPYFVMELVRGVPITEYCDKNKLSTAQRLGLFIPVCQAIQHAHQKGVIHRDIKPTNVMVTLHDGNPVPKVIDFGIAKATNQKLTEKTLFTNYAQMIGTPAYMSPEQAEMSGLDVDTRTDVYSLGVLLYELLTGTTPFPTKELLSLGYGQMQKIIVEKEPPKPSTRLSTMQHEERTVVAKNRSMEVGALGRMFKGDLDWIVMKALEKDRTRRYETVNGLAADIKRHLNNEPVSAAAPTFSYQLSKFARRNSKYMRVAAAVAALLLMALLFSTFQAVRATRARMAAEAARRAAQQSESTAREAQANEAKLRNQSDTQARAARRRAYASDIRLAQQALEMNDLGRAQQLLERQAPGPGENDLRGWEWRYLWEQARPDDHQVLRGGGQRVYSMSFSSDGRYLAWVEASPTNNLAVLELSTRRIVFEQDSYAGSCAFAHHVPWLAYTTREFDPTNGSIFPVHLLDVNAGKEVNQVTVNQPYASPAWQLAFSPDDRTLLALSPTELRATNIATGQTLWVTRVVLFGGGRWLERLSVSPDGTAVAVAVDESKITVFELKDGKERFTIQATDDLMTGPVQFSPDSATLLTTAAYADSAIRLWDAHDGHSLGKLEGHRGYVTGLIFTPDGRKLISSSGDYTIRLWDWPERQPAGVLRGHVKEVDGIALSPGRKSLASRSSDGTIFLWDITHLHKHGGSSILSSESEREWAQVALRGYPQVRFSRDGKSIVRLSRSGILNSWDTASLERSELPAARLKRGSVAGLSPDGTQIVVADWSESLAFKVLDAQSGLEITNFPSALPSSPELNELAPPRRNPFAYLQDGRCLLRWSGRLVVTNTSEPSGENILDVAGKRPAAGSGQREVRQAQWIVSLDSWDTASWRQAHREYSSTFFPKHGQFYSITLRPLAVPGFIALTGPGGIIVLDVNQTNLGPRTIENPRPSTYLGGFAASPDGSTAAVATEDGYVTILDWKTLKVIRSFKGFLLGAHSVAYSPDGRRLAVGGSGNEAVKLWDTDSWEELLTLRDEGSIFSSLQFSPDGRLLVAANQLGRVCAWATPSVQEIAADEAKTTAGAKQP